MSGQTSLPVGVYPMDRMDSRIEKFRGHAEACEALVFITKHHDARQQLLDIAKQWRDLMIRAEMIQQLARLEWGDPADPCCQRAPF